MAARHAVHIPGPHLFPMLHAHDNVPHTCSPTQVPKPTPRTNSAARLAAPQRSHGVMYAMYSPLRGGLYTLPKGAAAAAPSSVAAAALDAYMLPPLQGAGSSGGFGGAHAGSSLGLDGCAGDRDVQLGPPPMWQPALSRASSSMAGVMMREQALVEDGLPNALQPLHPFVTGQEPQRLALQVAVPGVPPAAVGPLTARSPRRRWGDSTLAQQQQQHSPPEVRGQRSRWELGALVSSLELPAGEVLGLPSPDRVRASTGNMEQMSVGGAPAAAVPADQHGVCKTWAGHVEASPGHAHWNPLYDPAAGSSPVLSFM